MARKRGWCFWGGVDTPMHTMLSKPALHVVCLPTHYNINLFFNIRLNQELYNGSDQNKVSYKEQGHLFLQTPFPNKRLNFCFPCQRPLLSSKIMSLQETNRVLPLLEEYDIPTPTSSHNESKGKFALAEFFFLFYFFYLFLFAYSMVPFFYCHKIFKKDSPHNTLLAGYYISQITP